MAEEPKTKNDDLILRDTLAIDRTRLANQRTLLAFSRTGLYLIVTALAIFKFAEDGRYDWIAWILIGLGAGVVTTGLINYLLMRRKILNTYNSKT